VVSQIRKSGPGASELFFTGRENDHRSFDSAEHKERALLRSGCQFFDVETFLKQNDLKVKDTSSA
jgi:hypothetical protein